MAQKTSNCGTISDNNIWLNLKKDFLCDEGKEIVSKDPNLSDETIKKLFALLPAERKIHEFYFSKGSDGDTDIGFPLVSSCINDNIYATMAELVTRYAEMRQVPFAEAANALNALKKEGRLFYYRKKSDNEYISVKWEPRYISLYNKPPAKKAM